MFNKCCRILIPRPAKKVIQAIFRHYQFGTNTLAGLVFVDGWAGLDYDPNALPNVLQWVSESPDPDSAPCDDIDCGNHDLAHSDAKEGK